MNIHIAFRQTCRYIWQHIGSDYQPDLPVICRRKTVGISCLHADNNIPAAQQPAGIL